AVALGNDPAGLALKHVELLHLAGDLWHDLRRRRARADDGDFLAPQVMLVLPAGRVEPGSLELLEARPVRIARHVEKADGADEHVALFCRAVAEKYVIHLARLVPPGALDCGSQPEVRPQPVLVDDLGEVTENFRLLGVGPRPGKPLLERI